MEVLMSVKSYVLINVNSREIKNALTKLRASKKILSAEAVTGPYDIVVVVEAENMDLLGKVVTNNILKVSGIERSLTCIVLNT